MAGPALTRPVLMHDRSVPLTAEFREQGDRLVADLRWSEGCGVEQSTPMTRERIREASPNRTFAAVSTGVGVAAALGGIYTLDKASSANTDVYCGDYEEGDSCNSEQGVLKSAAGGLFVLAAAAGTVGVIGLLMKPVKTTTVVGKSSHVQRSPALMPCGTPAELAGVTVAVNLPNGTKLIGIANAEGRVEIASFDASASFSGIELPVSIEQVPPRTSHLLKPGAVIGSMQLARPRVAHSQPRARPADARRRSASPR
jgi:hypothetical protein